MKILDGSYSDLKHKHLVLHVHNSLKAENKTQEASAGGLRASSSSSRLLIIFINANVFRIYFFH